MTYNCEKFKKNVKINLINTWNDYKPSILTSRQFNSFEVMKNIRMFSGEKTNLILHQVVYKKVNVQWFFSPWAYDSEY